MKSLNFINCFLYMEMLVEQHKNSYKNRNVGISKYSSTNKMKRDILRSKVTSHNILQSFGGENESFNMKANKEMKKGITRMNF